MCGKSYVKNGSSSSLVQQNGNLRSTPLIYLFIWKLGDFDIDNQIDIYCDFGESIVLGKEGWFGSFI